MSVLIANKPSSFKSNGPVRILDNHKKLFYKHPNTEGAITFNLPKGIYHNTTRATITRLPEFQPYQVPPSIAQWVTDVPREYDVEVAENPNKATVWIKKQKIKLDKAIRNIDYRPALAFVLFHELSHYFWHRVPGKTYTDEEKLDIEKHCDANAYFIMIRSGYNPTQIKAAIEILMEESQPERRQALSDLLNELPTRR